VGAPGLPAALDAAQLAPVLADILPGAPAACIDAAAASLAPHFQARQVPRRQPVLRQGELWNRALLVDSGLIRMHFVDRDGHEFNKNFFAEGSLVCPIAPAMWLAPSLFGISTIEPTRLWAADATLLRTRLGAPGLWRDLQCELLARLLTGKLQREHDLLALDGRQRYDAFCRRQPGLAARVPLKHLASYLGLTDVSLSRLRRTTATGRAL